MQSVLVPSISTAKTGADRFSTISAPASSPKLFCFSRSVSDFFMPFMFSQEPDKYSKPCRCSNSNSCANCYRHAFFHFFFVNFHICKRGFLFIQIHYIRICLRNIIFLNICCFTADAGRCCCVSSSRFCCISFGCFCCCIRSSGGFCRSGLTFCSCSTLCIGRTGGTSRTGGAGCAGSGLCYVFCNSFGNRLSGLVITWASRSE